MKIQKCLVQSIKISSWTLEESIEQRLWVTRYREPARRKDPRRVERRKGLKKKKITWTNKKIRERRDTKKKIFDCKKLPEKNSSK